MNILFRKKITGCESSQIRTLINDMMNSLMSWHDLCENDEYEFRLILSELIANGAFHGNKGLCDKGLTAILQEADSKTICITIQDEGTGFNYNDICCGTYPCDKSPMSERGRGLKLIKAICNDITFNPSGNQIKIKKSINPISII